MKSLLISDRHGELGIIEEPVNHAETDTVIHAGDCGFYGGGSLQHLTRRTNSEE